jgi:hypothetical protein
VEVTIVEVEAVVTIMGSCVMVTTAKKAAPTGLMKSDYNTSDIWTTQR